MRTSGAGPCIARAPAPGFRRIATGRSHARPVEALPEAAPLAIPMGFARCESLVEAAYARQRFAAPDMRAVFGYSQLAADAEPERDPGGDVGEEFFVGEMRIGKAQEARDRSAVADAPPTACSGCPAAGESWHGGG